METDAHGQLGGYDTTEAVRQRLAGESPSYRCPSCGRTNGEIMKECEERAKEADTDGQEVDIPEELSMGFKDQMASEKKSDNSSAEIPPRNQVPTSQAVSAINNASSSTPPNQAQPAVQPIATPQWQTREPSPRALNTITDPQFGVPIWIDRLIVGLVVLLAALVLKVLFGA